MGIKKNKIKPLVSIVTPSYNCEKYIASTIESVLNQTYSNFEMIIVDDISTDKTTDIIKKYQKKDKRIKLIVLDKKGGASIARNRAIKEAKGKYIAFLDSDDMWYEEKLEKQITWMENNSINFSYTDYEYINENNEKLNIKRVCPKKMSYFRMLLGDSIGCLTVVYNREKTGLIQIPRIDKRNDYALWCVILKKLEKGYKYDEILAKYRKTNSGTLSSGSKFKLIKYHYQLHHEINKFNSIMSCLFTFTNIINFILNKKVREKNLCLKKKIGIVGHFAVGKNNNDGQTVKTQNLYRELERTYGKKNIQIIDTCNWKKHPFKLLFNCFEMAKNCENIIILPAKNGVKVFVPLFNFINKRSKIQLHYVLIGSWLYDLVCADNKLISNLKKFNGIYVENSTLLKKLKTLNLENVFLMYNFKDIKPISKDKIKLTKDKIIKTCIFSRIMREKGVEDAISCIQQISSEHKNIKIALDIYGPIDKKYENDFLKICNEFPSNIKYCGVIDNRKTVETLKNYDLLLFPTHFKTEGIPGTILDAYASGVPVLASKWENYKEIINEETGVVFEINNNKDFYEKLEALITNTDKINDLKLGALKKYEEYSPNKAIKVLIENIERK